MQTAPADMLEDPAVAVGVRWFGLAVVHKFKNTDLALLVTLQPNNMVCVCHKLICSRLNVWLHFMG